MHPQLENIRGGQGGGILEWLAGACRHFRERIAIEWRDQELSFGALDEMVNRVANCLIANEVLPGSIVVVMLDDRIGTIAALLAIFRAGAVFVPLDGSLPEERLRRIVADLSPDGFIIGEAYRDKVNAISARHKRTKVITLGGLSRSATFDDGLIPVEKPLEDFSAESPAIRIDPDAVRYIYYTSGSTGQPKGIAGRLAGLSHFIQWEIETFKIDVGWRVSQFISPTFDAYFRDVLVPLCAGGTVCIPPDSPGNLKADALIEWIDRGRIDLIHCVPSLLQAVLGGNLDSERFKSLKHVLLSGEVLHVADVKRWMEVFGDRIALVNLYGATETTMVKFFYIVQQSDLSRGFIPIGKPMKGAKALVLDDRQRVCPPGVAGEIYIRTPYRTLGYYKNPGATKEVFVQNPYRDDPNDLIYRSGDLGLILNDGNFRFLGRKDNQVKIRGIRVELGEIENHLLNHPLVGGAVVLVREDVPGDVRLVAYIVAKQGAAPSVTDLRDLLKRELPDYMVPSAFITLDLFPLTPNGKVDRQALPANSQNRPELEEGIVAPRTPTEEVLAGIWAELLHVEQVGIHDNFFDLGGHSLLATQVISKVFKTLQVELPVRSFFEAPTVAGLADLIETIGWTGQGRQLPIESNDECEEGDL
jgi:amino acid adenylation domain-containing protein